MHTGRTRTILLTMKGAERIHSMPLDVFRGVYHFRFWGGGGFTGSVKACGPNIGFWFLPPRRCSIATGPYKGPEIFYLHLERRVRLPRLETLHRDLRIDTSCVSKDGLKSWSTGRHHCLFASLDANARQDSKIWSNLILSAQAASGVVPADVEQLVDTFDGRKL